MSNACQIVFTEHGSPVVAECGPHVGHCWLCAAPMTRGLPVDSWMGANFTGQNRVRLPTATHVCEPCVYCCAGRPPDTQRMWSHLHDERGYQRLNKGSKPAMREFLARHHASEWFAAIADSGQKHLLPWTPINRPGVGGLVYFEERVVRVPADQLLVSTMADLLTGGVTKPELGARLECLNELIRDIESQPREAGVAETHTHELATIAAEATARGLEVYLPVGDVTDWRPALQAAGAEDLADRVAESAGYQAC